MRWRTVDCRHTDTGIWQISESGLQCSTVKYSKIQYSKVQHSTTALQQQPLVSSWWWQLQPQCPHDRVIPCSGDGSTVLVIENGSYVLYYYLLLAWPVPWSVDVLTPDFRPPTFDPGPQCSGGQWVGTVAILMQKRHWSIMLVYYFTSSALYKVPADRCVASGV